MQAKSPFPIPIFSLNLSTHSTNPLPVSAHAWLSKTAQIHPLTLMRTCKSGHLSHTHTQYTFHTHFYYHHSLSTPPCTMSFLIYSSYPCTIANPTTIFTSIHMPHLLPHSLSSILPCSFISTMHSPNASSRRNHGKPGVVRQGSRRCHHWFHWYGCATWIPKL